MLEVLTLVLMVYLILGLHELGHFLALRRYGVRVEVFALGGPPWVWRKHFKAVEYRLGLVPFLGFVAPDQREVDRLSPVRLTWVFLAGPAMNFLGALAGAVLLSLWMGSWGPLVRTSELMFSLPYLLVQGLVDFFRGTAPADATGFLAFFKQGASVVGSIEGVLGLWVALHLIVGWYNLLPIAPLDGGQVLLAWLRGWRYAEAVKLGFTLLGVGFLLATLVFALGYDLGFLGR